MPILFPKAFRLFAVSGAALVLLAACGEPTAPAPDPLDAESLANRLEGLSRRAPQMDGILLSAAGVHFRDAARVTPITVVIDGQTETWYAASSETVIPAMACPSPSPGLFCPPTGAIMHRQLVAVDGVDAMRLLMFSTIGGFDAVLTPPDPERPRLPVSGLLLERGKGVQAFATGGSMTSSVVATLGDCPRRPRRGPAAPPIESCERVSLAWEVDVELTSLRSDAAAPTTISVAIPAIEVSGVRLVFASPMFPRR